ncbi:MAG: ZIP family metal transporter [Thermoplasmata archaeon M9B1D]|nr:MAG: ZIP family metal transporter [Thermoplasmata archaeon M9B1D]PNX47232.1 MAG: ZIP family metal transporter [Thermoplasmata archaeon M8B2D]
MIELLYIIVVTFAIALIAFIGIFTLLLKEKLLNKILLILVSLSAGALMGGAFLHLIPEAVEKSQGTDIFLFVLVGFILFFVIEKVLHWRHCHKGKCDVHTFTYMNLVGDTIHNFIDGLILAASFVTSVELGLTTTIAIAAHEIPQEIGDFGVLIYGGFKKKKAIILNFIVALTIVIGGVIGYFISKSVESAVTFLLPFAAGGFIYIAATDLIPEIKKELDFKKYMATLIVFIIGILIMWFIKLYFSH